MSAIIFPIAITACVFITIIFRALERKKFENSRAPEELIETYKSISAHISFETFRDVMNSVGEIYNLNPKILRPSDTLKKLYEIDSWNIGTSAENLNKWLIKKGIRGHEFSGKTILDLAIYIEKNKGLRARSKSSC